MSGILDALLRVIPFSNAGLELITRGKWQAGTGIEFEDDPDTGRTKIVATGEVEAVSPLTTKGDLYTRNASADARLAVGSNGYVLSADSTEATGLKWIALPGSGGLHASTHEDGGADEIDGGNLAYTASPTNYTPTANSTGGHFAGIDTQLGVLESDIADNAADIDTNATAISTLSGQLAAKAIGAPGATDNAVARYDGTGGLQLQNSVVIVDDSGNVTGVATQEISSAAPYLRFYETGVATDQGKWEFGVNGSTWTFRTLEDDNTPGLDILSVARTSGTFANHLRAHIGLWSDANSPQIGWIDADHTSGEQRWLSTVANGSWRLEARNDSNSSGNAAMTVARSAQLITDVQAKTRYGDVQLAPVYSVTEGETDESIETNSVTFNLLGSALNLGTIEEGYKYAFTIWIHATPQDGSNFYADDSKTSRVVSLEAMCQLVVVRRTGGNAQSVGFVKTAIDTYYHPEDGPTSENQFFEGLDLQVDLTSNVLTIQPRLIDGTRASGWFLSVQVDASYVRTPAPAVPTEIP